MADLTEHKADLQRLQQQIIKKQQLVDRVEAIDRSVAELQQERNSLMAEADAMTAPATVAPTITQVPDPPNSGATLLTNEQLQTFFDEAHTRNHSINIDTDGSIVAFSCGVCGINTTRDGPRLHRDNPYMSIQSLRAHYTMKHKIMVASIDNLKQMCAKRKLSNDELKLIAEGTLVLPVVQPDAGDSGTVPRRASMPDNLLASAQPDEEMEDAPVSNAPVTRSRRSE